MKRYVFFLVLFCFVIKGIGQSYQVVDKGSVVKILIRNLGMEVEGRMTGLDGDINFNPADLKRSSFSVHVDANTISTGIDVRDSALKTEAYLNAKQFPQISFVSRQITQANNNAPYTMRGTLTIKGTSKEIVFPFTVTVKNDGLLFSGEMKINRRDFAIAQGSTVLSDNITVALAVFARKL